MKFDVMIPISGFENEKEFVFSKIDDFFSTIKAVDSQRELKLMNFGALKTLSFQLPDELIEKLKINSIDDISIFYIFVLQTNSSSSINTFSPIIINHKTNTIGQAHLNLDDLGCDTFTSIMPNF